MSLARESAVDALERIGRGELGRSILPWVPLKAGGGDAAVVQEWVRQTQAEPRAERQAEYAGLAKVFADWVGCLPAWKQALEGWNVWQSQVIKEWKDATRQEGLQEGRLQGQLEGQLEASRGQLLKLLRTRFQSEVPADLTQTIEQTTKLETLSQWFDSALTASTLEAFRSAVQGPPPPINGA